MERFVSEKVSMSEYFKKFKANCPYLYKEDMPPRPVNGLNIEIGPPQDRCGLKLPAHWPQGARNRGAARWVLSGGSALIFGCCDINDCGLGYEWCPDCGHRKDQHFMGMCIVDIGGWPCGCEYYQTANKRIERTAKSAAAHA